MVGVLCRVRAPSPPQQPSDSSFHDGSEVKASAPNAGGPGSQVQPLGQEDSLEKEIATYSSILAWRIPWKEGTWQARESQRVGHD